MATTIKRIEGTTDLWCKYSGQTNSQPVYIDLDLDTGVVTAGYNAEIGNAVPMAVWNGKVLRWSVPVVPTAEAMNRELAQLLPQFDRVASGQENAEGVQLEIEYHLQTCFDTDDQVIVWAAGDWLSGTSSESLGITADTTEAEAEEIARKLCDEAKDEGVHILDGVESEIEYRMEQTKLVEA